ncbi:MAG: DNA-binding domain-containing protein, partial [Methylocella sp.]
MKEPRDATQPWQRNFARALRDPGLVLPQGVTSYNSEAPQERFAVYRNNVMVGLVSALQARFPATRKIAGEDFFK